MLFALSKDTQPRIGSGEKTGLERGAQSASDSVPHQLPSIGIGGEGVAGLGLAVLGLEVRSLPLRGAKSNSGRAPEAKTAFQLGIEA